MLDFRGVTERRVVNFMTVVSVFKHALGLQ